MKKLFLLLLASLFVLLLSAQSLTLSTNSVNIDATAGSKATFTINSDSYWGIYNLPDWISLDTVWGNGDRTIEITVNENPYTIQRRAKLTVYWLDANWIYYADVPLQIIQKPSDKGIADTLITIGSENGNTTTIDIVSDTYWEVVDLPSWLTVTTSWGVSNAAVELTTAKNPLTVVREGTFQIRRLGANSEYIYGSVNIKQAASLTGISTGKIVLEPGESTSEQVMLYINDAWNMTGVSDWITPSLTSHTGNAFVTFTANANPMIYYRADTVQITTNAGIVYEIELIQKPAVAYLSIDPAYFSFQESQTEIEVTVSSNTNWGIIEIPEWIGSENIYGYGDSTFTISYTDYVSARKDTIIAYWFDEYEVYHQHPVIAGQGLRLGVKSESMECISIYPSIVQNMFRINVPESEIIQGVQVLSMLGLLVKQCTYSDNYIDISDCNTGQYLVLITTDCGVYSKKIIKK